MDHPKDHSLSGRLDFQGFLISNKSTNLDMEWSCRFLLFDKAQNVPQPPLHRKFAEKGFSGGYPFSHNLTSGEMWRLKPADRTHTLSFQRFSWMPGFFFTLSSSSMLSVDLSGQTNKQKTRLKCMLHGEKCDGKSISSHHFSSPHIYSADIKFSLSPWWHFQQLPPPTATSSRLDV